MNVLKSLMLFLAYTLLPPSPALADTPSVKGQPDKSLPENRLYQYGVADAFVGGLYKGTLPISELKKNGDFGLGAPDMLDGELMMYEGKVFQTQASGLTRIVPNTFKTSLSFVTFFKPDMQFEMTNSTAREQVLALIEQKLTNKNGLYAIKITGRFDSIRTRAFPPVTAEPFPPLSTIMDRQHFFDMKNTKGVLVGYKFPSYLNGINVAGYHFHFLSENERDGGHVLDFVGNDLKIEVAALNRFDLEIPKVGEFQQFKFKDNRNEDLERAEQGR